MQNIDMTISPSYILIKNFPRRRIRCASLLYARPSVTQVALFPKLIHTYRPRRPWFVLYCMQKKSTSSTMPLNPLNLSKDTLLASPRIWYFVNFSNFLLTFVPISSLVQVNKYWILEIFFNENYSSSARTYFCFSLLLCISSSG